MPQSLKQQWGEFKRAKPGERFQQRYERHKRDRARGFNAARLLMWLAALVPFALGVIFAFIPGPAVVFFLIAGGMLAGESRVIARFMDWLELKIRAVVRWGRRRWKQLPTPGKVGVAVFGVCCSFGATYFSYRLFSGR